MDETIIYRIPSPYGIGDKFIEVYGDPNMAWYEWRVMDSGKIVFDTKDLAYGNPEIALRDALIDLS